MQALFVLAFAIGLAALARAAATPAPRRRPLRAVPLAVLAVGSVYAYSFPGLLWLGGAAAVWAAVELARAWREAAAAGAGAGRRAGRPRRRWSRSRLFALAIAPELGRIVDFARFETFDPAGAGLGNLFNRLSPLEALGIWPSGDFRVEPGDGAVPAIVFYLGARRRAGGARLRARWWWRARRARGAGARSPRRSLLWLYALVAGTPYQEAKALVLLAPLVALISVRALLAAAPALIAAAFLAAAGGSSVLALANGPVGPSGYSPELAELRAQLGDGSVLRRGARASCSTSSTAATTSSGSCAATGSASTAPEVPDEPPAGISTMVAVTVDGGAVVPEACSATRSGACRRRTVPVHPDGVRRRSGPRRTDCATRG